MRKQSSTKQPFIFRFLCEKTFKEANSERTLCDQVQCHAQLLCNSSTDSLRYVIEMCYFCSIQHHLYVGIRGQIYYFSHFIIRRANFWLVERVNNFSWQRAVGNFNFAAMPNTARERLSMTFVFFLRMANSSTAVIKSDFLRVSRVGRHSWKINFSYISPKHTFGWTHSWKNSPKFQRFILRPKPKKVRNLHIVAVFAA